MGYPIDGTDWCPSNLISEQNFSIPTYSLSTAVKSTKNTENPKKVCKVFPFNRDHEDQVVGNSGPANNGDMGNIEV